jgi:hypothetical protein
LSVTDLAPALFRSGFHKDEMHRFDCEVFMPRSSLSLRAFQPGAFLAFVVVGAVAIAACSKEPQSLANYIAAICSASFRSAAASEAPYLADNVGAMTKMMVDMGIRPTGDVDRDFVSMMVPHHQGAIDMAQAELRYGRNEQLRRMA